MNEHEVVIVGGGQAGLATARCLQRRGINPLVLDASDRVGGGWRHRYDSLVLFTPSQYDSLPDTPFPLPADTYPTKDGVADYLERYAEDHAIDVRSGVRVRSVTFDDRTERFVLEAGGATLTARHVVVATGGVQRPRVPEFTARLDKAIQQLHSSEYRNPASVRAESVVIVGAGNSGMQIAEELAEHRRTTICFTRLPKRLPQRLLGKDIFWWLIRIGMMDRTATGAGGAQAAVGSIPLIGSCLPKLLRSGRLDRRERVVDASGQTLHFADGSEMPVEAVIWATGFRNDFSWIDVPGVVGDTGAPLHRRGVAEVVGLYFIGLPGLHTKGSGFLGWVGRDAEYLAAAIATRAGRTRRSPAAPPPSGETIPLM